MGTSATTKNAPFKVTSLNEVAKRRQGEKILMENERLLKKIVDITFKRKKSALPSSSFNVNKLNHQELALKPYIIKQHHSGEQMIKDLKRIKRENKAYFNMLADVNISRERSPGIITNRKLESQHVKSRELHRNTSRIHSRSPLHSGLK